ncbi:MAG: hypothetical protein V4598_11185 [Bdellovibrionota bacterium]
MKTFITKSKSSLFLLAFMAFPLWAKPVAQVTELSGSVFVVKPDGKTSMLKVNDHLEDKSEVMVEEGASITMNDYYDATYHLIGGTHLKFFDRSAQLKRGKTWIQCMNGRFPLALTTANGHANFWKGEFIVTFDQATSRSQFLVVNGDVEVSNVLERDLKYTVPAGTFTLVDPEVEDGAPRAPTKVGLASLDNALSEFKKLPADLKEGATPTRSIASVEEAPKRGEITFIKSNRLPASVNGGAHKYFAKKVKKEAMNDAPIRYIGTSWKPFVAPRRPASVAPMAISPKKSAPQTLDPEFGDSLKRKVSEQPKFPKELDSLIEDLKSY